MKSKPITYTRNKFFILLLICALLISVLPFEQIPVSKAEETFDSAEDEESSDYGLNNPSISDGVTTWDCVWFGNYWQNDTNGDGTADKNDDKEPIKWRILSVDGDDVFLLADKNLDVQRYNAFKEDVTWETCTMRSWLNGYGAAFNKDGKDYSADNFLNNAFNTTERVALKNTTVSNEDNPYYGTEGGNNTTDKVYFLSLSEVMNPSYGFTSTVWSTDTREAVNTAYVAAGGEIKSSEMNSAGSTDHWRLRSPGHDSYDASIVDHDGYVLKGSMGVKYDHYAVRPALHLNLSYSSSWSRAGTVASDGGGTEISPPPTQTPPSTPTPTPSSTPTVTQTPQTTLTPTPAPTLKPTAKPTSIPTQLPVSTSKPILTPDPVQSIVPPVSAAQNVNPVNSLISSVATAALVAEEAEQQAEEKPSRVTGLKVKAKKKAVQASWKKVSGVSGYELSYSASKKFAKSKKKTVKNTKFTINKLKSGKVYFVKVRAYTVRNGKKTYGAWSKVVKKKVK